MNSSPLNISSSSSTHLNSTLFKDAHQFRQLLRSIGSFNALALNENRDIIPATLTRSLWSSQYTNEHLIEFHVMLLLLRGQHLLDHPDDIQLVKKVAEKVGLILNNERSIHTHAQLHKLISTIFADIHDVHNPNQSNRASEARSISLLAEYYCAHKEELKPHALDINNAIDAIGTKLLKADLSRLQTMPTHPLFSFNAVDFTSKPESVDDKDGRSNGFSSDEEDSKEKSEGKKQEVKAKELSSQDGSENETNSNEIAAAANSSEPGVYGIPQSVIDFSKRILTRNELFTRLQTEVGGHNQNSPWDIDYAFLQLIGKKQFSSKKCTTLECWVYQTFLNSACGTRYQNSGDLISLFDIHALIRNFGFNNAFTLLCRGYQLAYEFSDSGSSRERIQAKNAATVLQSSLEELLAKYPVKATLHDIKTLPFHADQVSFKFVDELEQTNDKKRDNYATLTAVVLTVLGALYCTKRLINKIHSNPRDEKSSILQNNTQNAFPNNTLANRTIVELKSNLTLTDTGLPHDIDNGTLLHNDNNADINTVIAQASDAEDTEELEDTEQLEDQENTGISASFEKTRDNQKLIDKDSSSTHSITEDDQEKSVTCPSKTSSNISTSPHQSQTDESLSAVENEVKATNPTLEKTQQNEERKKETNEPALELPETKLSNEKSIKNEEIQQNPTKTNNGSPQFPSSTNVDVINAHIAQQNPIEVVVPSKSKELDSSESASTKANENPTPTAPISDVPPTPPLEQPVRRRRSQKRELGVWDGVYGILILAGTILLGKGYQRWQRQRQLNKAAQNSSQPTSLPSPKNSSQKTPDIQVTPPSPSDSSSSSSSSSTASSSSSSSLPLPAISTSQSSPSSSSDSIPTTPSPSPSASTPPLANSQIPNPLPVPSPVPSPTNAGTPSPTSTGADSYIMVDKTPPASPPSQPVPNP